MANKYGITKEQLKEEIRRLREEHSNPDNAINFSITKALNDLERRLKL